MSLLQIYLRVLALLAPERWLATALAAANVALAMVFLLEPWLFGRVVDALAAPGPANAWRYIGWWTGVGFFGVAANVLVALYSDRLAHRRRLAAVIDFFEHALALPLAFHDRQHTGRLLRTLHTGSSNLFHLWLAFFRSHLSTLIALLVMVPLSLWVNWKLALLMMVLMCTFTLFNTLVIRRTGQAQRSVEQLNQEISQRAGDLFGNVMVVQSFARVLAEVAALRSLATQVLTTQYPVLRGWAWVSVANRAASTLTVVGLFALGVQLHGRGEISVGGIVSFVGFALMMIGRMEQLAGFISELFFQAPSLANFFEVLDTRSHLPELSGAPPSCATCAARSPSRTWRSATRPPNRCCPISASGSSPAAWWPWSAHRGGQDHGTLAAVPCPRPQPRPHHHRRHRHPHRDPRLAPRPHRGGVPEPGSALPLDRRQPAHGQARRQRRRAPGRSSRRRGAPVRGR